jgi:hypothetical protein
MWDLIKNHFDKFLLAFFVLYFTFLGWHAVFYLSHHDGALGSSPVVQSFMAAMLDNQKLVIGALLGLITGRALASSPKTNGGTSDSTVSSGIDTPVSK